MNLFVEITVITPFFVVPTSLAENQIGLLYNNSKTTLLCKIIKICIIAIVIERQVHK